MVGGSGGWQISQTNAYDELGVDCVVEGRSEAENAGALRQGARGERLPRKVDVHHPQTRDEIIFPDKRTTFGVVEMTTGCGRRCQFCVPDLNPQIDLPRDKILAHVRANVRDGNKQISLATEDMFIWGQVHTKTPFYFPNREALLDLYRSVVNTPGVEQHVLSHATIAPAVVDPILIEQLTESIIDKSPIHLPVLSTHPKKKALVPLIGLETGSVARAKAIMPSKAVPFPIDEWPSVVDPRAGSAQQAQLVPGDDAHHRQPERDRRRREGDARRDLRGRAARAVRVLHPVDLHAAPRHADGEQEGRDRDRAADAAAVAADDEVLEDEPAPRQASWWAPTAWRLGAIVLWAWKLRKLNGPGFTWPLFLFASALPESLMAKMGKIYVGKPLNIKTRKELLETIKPSMRRTCARIPAICQTDFVPPPPEITTAGVHSLTAQGV